jgi:hypothetical protein
MKVTTNELKVTSQVSSSEGNTSLIRFFETLIRLVNVVTKDNINIFIHFISN